MDLYFDERQRKKRQRFLKLKIYGGVTLFFVLIIGAGYAIVYSPLFNLKNMQISVDNKQIDTDEVIEDLKNFFASQSKIASFLGANNILIWQTEIDDFLKKYPQIEKLTIEKDYFEREIKINIKERNKFGIWCEQTRNYADKDAELRGKEEILRESAFSPRESVCFWFDKNGIIFSEAPIVEGNLINKVDDFSGQTLKLGEIVIKENLFFNLVKIFEVLEKSDLKIKSLKLERLELQEIIADSGTSLLPKIYFSLRIDPGFSLSALESFKNLGLEKIEYIDLRVENRAYYKIRK